MLKFSAHIVIVVLWLVKPGGGCRFWGWLKLKALRILGSHVLSTVVRPLSEYGGRVQNLD